MKRVYFLLLAFLFCATNLKAQYKQLVPSWQNAPNASITIPDYGSLLQTIEEEIIMWGDIRCKESIDEQLNNSIVSARSQVRSKTTYMVVADVTYKSDCRITVFRQLRYGETPSVLHTPETHLLVYTIDIYPWIFIGSNAY